MIYDGPFSDSVLNQEIKGLDKEECTSDQAKEYLQNIFGSTMSLIEYLGQTQGKFVTYDFQLTSKNYKVYYVQVTRQGKFLLNLSSQSSVGGGVVSIEEAKTKAVEFAKKLNLDLSPVWEASANGIAYINLAPTINQAIIYPDLIKVKVDLASAEIVGWEATNYATNHVDRSFSNTIGLLDAEKSINKILNIQERNLCIIPDKFVGELSAYEFICTWEGYTYYIYIHIFIRV
jgi:germination protein YpeB